MLHLQDHASHGLHLRGFLARAYCTTTDPPMSPFGKRLDLLEGLTWALLPHLPQHMQPNPFAGTWAPGSDFATLL